MKKTSYDLADQLGKCGDSLSYQLTNTAPGSSTKWYETVVMPVLRVFWQKIVRVEHIRVLVVLWVAVDFKSTNDHSRTSR